MTTLPIQRDLRMKLIQPLMAVVLLAAVNVPAGWNPELFQKAWSLQLYTTTGNGEGHWSRVWVVVIDGAPYLRLGSQAAFRIDSNAGAPYVKVRIADHEFDRVMAQSVPEMADRVAAAMAEKYWTDVFIRYLRHALIVRLVPAS